MRFFIKLSDDRPQSDFRRFHHKNVDDISELVILLTAHSFCSRSLERWVLVPKKATIRNQTLPIFDSFLFPVYKFRELRVIKRFRRRDEICKLSMDVNDSAVQINNIHEQKITKQKIRKNIIAQRP